MAAVGQPAGERRRVAVVERTAQHALGQAVDLEKDHPGDVRRVLLAEAAPSPAHEAQLVGVAVDPEHRDGDHGHDRQSEGGDQRGPEVRARSVHGVDRERDDQGVPDQRAQAQRQHRDRQEETGQQRPEQAVEDRDQRRCPKRAVARGNRDPRQQRRQHQEGQRGHQPQRQHSNEQSQSAVAGAGHQCARMLSCRHRRRPAMSPWTA